jgi:hypothetical protein
MTEQQWNVLVKKAIKKDFAWFVRRSRELERIFPPKVLREMKRTFMVAFRRAVAL